MWDWRERSPAGSLEKRHGVAPTVANESMVESPQVSTSVVENAVPSYEGSDDSIEVTEDRESQARRRYRRFGHGRVASPRLLDSSSSGPDQASAC